MPSTSGYPFGLTALCLVGIVISFRLKTRSLLGELRNKQAREARRKAAPADGEHPMNLRRKKRLTIILAISLGLASVTGALRSEPEHRLFYTPSRLVKGPEKISPEGSACASVAWHRGRGAVPSPVLSKQPSSWWTTAAIW